MSARSRISAGVRANRRTKECGCSGYSCGGSLRPAALSGAGTHSVELSTAVRQYSAVAAKIDYQRVPVSGAYTRRPLAGFNPLTYALQCPSYNRQEGRDPLADYLKAGRPEGSWVHPVVRVEGLASEDPVRPPATPESGKPFRVVLHGHFHYTDHLDEFMRALAVNSQPCHLIVTTDSTTKASEIRVAFRRNGLEPDIRVVPNRGRDIAPFLTVLQETIDNCELLGHLHGKRSLSTSNVDVDFGDRWRVFLWQHLIGDERPMLDVIRQAFVEDPALGLIFPEDPFLIGWEENFEIARSLAARMDLRQTVALHYRFPGWNDVLGTTQGACISPSSRTSHRRIPVRTALCGWNDTART